MPKGLNLPAIIGTFVAAAWVLCGGDGGRGTGTAFGFPIISGAATGTQTPDIVYKGDQIRPFIQAAVSRRVDVAGIGDSNQVHFGTGYDDGFQLALGQQFGLYATEVFPANA